MRFSRPAEAPSPNDKNKDSEVTLPLDQQSTFIKRPPRLGDEVYNSIYGQLMRQAILPGAKISIDNLVRELGVSQTPIREALSRLEAQGLVVKAQQGGYKAAAQMDLERFENLREIRMLLEPVTANKAAVRITELQLNELELVAKKMRSKAGRSDYGEFARLDQQFHDLIAQASGNALIAETLAKLHSHMHLFRLFHHQQATSESIAEHDVLIEALSAHDPERAEAAMRTHIERAFHRFSMFFTEKAMK
jgi:DNA-binding GntR family transcriptional regulator